MIKGEMVSCSDPKEVGRANMFKAVYMFETAGRTVCNVQNWAFTML